MVPIRVGVTKMAKNLSDKETWVSYCRKGAFGKNGRKRPGDGQDWDFWAKGMTLNDAENAVLVTFYL